MSLVEDDFIRTKTTYNHTVFYNLHRIEYYVILFLSVYLLCKYV